MLLFGFDCILCFQYLPSVLWRYWLGCRKGMWPLKTEQWGAGMVICLERDADLQKAQVMPLPLTVSCFSKIQIGFTFLVLAHLSSPGQRAVKRMCVCVCCVFSMCPEKGPEIQQIFSRKCFYCFQACFLRISHIVWSASGRRSVLYKKTSWTDGGVIWQETLVGPQNLVFDRAQSTDKKEHF